MTNFQMTATIQSEEFVPAPDDAEAALEVVVTRHVHAVFSTALRQTGDHGIAEEITQNVFLAYARKSRQLKEHPAIGGWLHRTAVLESKARMRSEIRRRTREEQAAQLAQVEQSGEQMFSALIPVLDEALMELREKDRVALIARFFEDRSFREVGQCLGIDEEAARKRVARALERISQIFHRRGAALSSAAAASLLGHAMQAAPASLAAAAMKSSAADLAAGGSKSLLAHLIDVPHGKMAVACALIMGIPLAWQWHKNRELARQHAAALSQTGSAEQTFLELRQEHDRARENLRRLTNERLRAEAQVVNAKRLAAISPAEPDYVWSDESPHVRTPKEFIASLSIDGASRLGELTPQICAVLQLTDGEKAAVEGALKSYLAAVHAAQQPTIRPIVPTALNLMGRKPEDTRAFELGDVREAAKEFRETLWDQIRPEIGEDRASLLRNSLSHWMRFHEPAGLNTELAVLEGPHQVQFYRPKPGGTQIGWGLVENGSSMSMELQVEEVPSIFLPFIADWVEIARENRAAALNQTPLP